MGNNVRSSKAACSASLAVNSSSSAACSLGHAARRLAHHPAQRDVVAQREDQRRVALRRPPRELREEHLLLDPQVRGLAKPLPAAPGTTRPLAEVEREHG